MQPGAFLHHEGMKKLVFTTTFFFAALLLHAQPTAVRLYGYRQRVHPGIKKAGDFDTSGNFIKKEPAPVFQYLIFLITTSKAPIQPTQLWLNGEAFAVETKIMEHPPMRQGNSDAPAPTFKPLFAQPAGTIYKLTPVPLTAGNSTPKGRKLAHENAVVVLYEKEGRLQYGVLKKLIDIESALLQ